MDSYKKPSIVSDVSGDGIIPLAALAGMSAAKLAVVGVAAGLGLGAAMRGGRKIDSSHTFALTARKNFSFA